MTKQRKPRSDRGQPRKPKSEPSAIAAAPVPASEPEVTNQLADAPVSGGDIRAADAPDKGGHGYADGEPLDEAVTERDGEAAPVPVGERAQDDEVQPATQVRSEASNSNLTPHELTGLIQEAWEAYDMQDIRVRFDSKGFKWWFGVVTDTGNSELKLQRSAPVGDFHVMYISTAELGRDVARELVESAVRALA